MLLSQLQRRFFRQLASGQVASDLRKTDKLARPVPERRDDDAGPEARAVRADAPAFFGEVPVRGCHAELPLRVAGISSFLREEEREISANDRGCLVALDLLGAGIP